ncbi:MAG: (deoxy)nucleoside triphosphate pyrophosphohydrolase [Alphaproteobacteria bacterium]|nr:(deoxy)nucleoside triphosphate pyrophosphohydrolase [Alphaproteobacteria bacterium]
MQNKPHVRVVAAEIERGGRYLITQRREQAVLPLLWEFPGGRVEPGESDADALNRELTERVGVTVEVGALSLHVAHEYDEYVLDLLVYRARLTEGAEPRPLMVRDARWVEPVEFANFEFPGADQKTVDALLKG